MIKKRVFMKDDKKKSMPMFQYNQNDVSITAINTQYQGFFKLDEYQLKHKLFSNKFSNEITREVFERGDAVVVMLYDPKHDNLLLLEQFRAGALRTEKTPWLIEFVAGMFNSDESPIDVAIREAKEETNITLRPENVKPIMKYLSSPGGMSECIHLYWAEFDSTRVTSGSVHGLDEENEDILLHLTSRVEALALLNEGKIINAATIVGLQWLAMNYQHL
jgi:ADP-ribose pyrophosphatase